MAPIWTIKQCIPVIMCLLSLSATVGAQDSLDLPDPLVFEDGTPVANADQWSSRRAEILNLFSEHVYGHTSTKYDSVRFVLVDSVPDMMDGAATRKQIDVTIYGTYANCTFRLLVFIPNAAPKPAPLFLLLCHRDASNIDPTRVQKSNFWPAESIVARGYCAAAILNDQLAGDYPTHYRNALINKLDGNGQYAIDDWRNHEYEPNSWKMIGAWAFGASRAMDYFETDDDIDEKHVGVVGHSRGGKASLWCGAQDERFALAIGNGSGNTGAALSRRDVGESVEALNRNFPHWCSDNYRQYNFNEVALPIDQHQLLALVAPRLVYVASGSTDGWADPRGEFLSCVYASPVYEFLGFDGVGADQWPATTEVCHSGRVGYHVHEGGHGLGVYDWGKFMDYADIHFTQDIVSSRARPNQKLSGGFTYEKPSRFAVYTLNGRVVSSTAALDIRRLVSAKGMYLISSDKTNRSFITVPIRGR